MKSEIESKELDGLPHQKRKRSASGNVKLEPGNSRHTHQDEGHEVRVYRFCIKQPDDSLLDKDIFPLYFLGLK